jgi:hypothetical protein
MSSYHPTDNELQQYALEGTLAGADIADHAQGCAACSAKLANYRLLGRQMYTLQKPAFDFNLADLVLQQLPAPKAEFPFQNLPALFGTILTASAIAVFAGMLNTMIKEHHDQMKKLDFN